MIYLYSFKCITNFFSYSLSKRFIITTPPFLLRPAMITRIMLFFSLIVLLVSIFLPVNTHASDMDDPHLNLSSEAQITATPDFINISIHIEQTHKEAHEAKKAVDITSQEVLALTQRFQIQAKNVEAAQISIHPDYRWHKNQRQLQGQKVTRQISIKLYQLDKYSDFVNQIASLEIARYQQRGYGFDDLSGLKTQALLKALDKTKQKAELVANKLGRKLGKVYAVNEKTQQQHFPMARALNSASADEHSPAPLKIQAQVIKAKVNVIYLLK